MQIAKEEERKANTHINTYEYKWQGMVEALKY